MKLIDKIQRIDLDALTKFSEICEQNNITFYLRGGTAMGAVKYGGFIPWDDDMDVAVPRKDYERLIEIFRNRSIDDKYVVYSYRYSDNVHSYFPRLALVEDIRKEMDLPKNTDKGLHLMDIIPLDGSPNNIFLRKIFYIRIYVLRAFASASTVYIGEHKNPHTKKQQIIVKIMRLLHIHKIFPQIKMYKKMDDMFKKYPWNESEYSGTVTASLGMKESFKTEVWGKGKKMKFENLNLLVPELYDEYLKQLYGENYMNYEPKEDEKKSHFI